MSLARALQKAQARIDALNARQTRGWQIVEVKEKPFRREKVGPEMTDERAANIAFCAVLDAYFDANPNATGHPFELMRVRINGPM